MIPSTTSCKRDGGTVQVEHSQSVALATIVLTTVDS